MTHMPDPSTARPTASDAGPSDQPGSAVAAASTRPPTIADPVLQAATDLRIPVPPGFRLLGVDDDGQYMAEVLGGPAVFTAAAAILDRLGGLPVDECLARMVTPAAESGPKPEWWPPEDSGDTEAILAYLAERENHPEWPRIYNGAADWVAVAAAAAAVGTTTVKVAAELIKDRRRTDLSRHVFDEAVRQGVTIDPAAVIQALNGAQPPAGPQSPPATEPAAPAPAQIERTNPPG